MNGLEALLFVVVAVLGILAGVALTIGLVNAAIEDSLRSRH